MSGNLTALYLQNPALANALRRQQSGAQMLRAGGDTSPVQHPLQGLARLAQALVGGYEEGQANKEIKGAAEAQRAQAEELMRPFPGMAPQAPQGAPVEPMTAPRQPVAQRPMAPAEYAPLIARASQETGIPEPVLTAYLQNESSFRPDARNPRSTAGGIAQILASTAADPGYGLEPLPDADRFVPEKAIPWIARYMAARGKAVGATDFANPQHVGRVYRAVGENTDDYERRLLTRAGMGGGAAAATVPGAGAGGEVTPVSMPTAGPAGGGGAPDPMRANYEAEAEYYAGQSQRAAAMGQPAMASVLMQRATMAMQRATMRQPQPNDTERLLAASGLQPGTDEYRQMARRLLETKAQGPQTNVTVSGGMTVPQQPPAGFRYVRRPLEGGGESLVMEAIPGGPADIKQREVEEKKAAGEKTKSRFANIVVEDIDRIGKLVDDASLPATGLGATTLSGIPGTAAADVSKLLDGIKGNIAFDRLTQMRAESPTGGALGAVSDRELALLQSVYGSLEQSQSKDQFKANLTRLRKVYMDIVHGPGKWEEVDPGQEVTPLSSGGGQGGGWSIRPVQ